MVFVVAQMSDGDDVARRRERVSQESEHVQTVDKVFVVTGRANHSASESG
ncbi:hypothetical protein Mycch_1614 [Mycolicibacterium chubuense NBB4]|uniref:Uncharacterized protein n=1 Tax=Mycolicibacterium chubuense (strain NBB4) TaxID=710421 RepID=I4BGK5_MYCCN|nr:hypothetical protein Mycch_1614 [Mycolicibacterium chubuense NBB4]